MLAGSLRMRNALFERDIWRPASAFTLREAYVCYFSRVRSILYNVQVTLIS